MKIDAWEKQLIIDALESKRVSKLRYVSPSVELEIKALEKVISALREDKPLEPA